MAGSARVWAAFFILITVFNGFVAVVNFLAGDVLAGVAFALVAAFFGWMAYNVVQDLRTR